MTPTAIAVAEAIRQLQPRVFTLENIPRYQKSESFAAILETLKLTVRVIEDGFDEIKDV